MKALLVASFLACATLASAAPAKTDGVVVRKWCTPLPVTECKKWYVTMMWGDKVSPPLEITKDLYLKLIAGEKPSWIKN